jgi:hypothetical protein
MNNTMNCGAERKFVVLKLDDINHLDAHFKLSLRSVQDAIWHYRLRSKKKLGNEYIVINTDEPYFWLIKLVMKMFGHWG